MKHTRKEFLQLSGSALAWLAISRASCSRTYTDRIDKLGIQMYSVKGLFEKNPKEALRMVAGFGYTQIENYERNEDMFWGLGNKGFKKYLEELGGLQLISSHCDIEKNFERKAGEAAEIGMKYLVYNWPFAQQPMDEYKRKIDLFNRCGEICKKEGIGFGYHNYESSFKLVDGIYPHDLIMEKTDPALVQHQMDIAWVVAAGQDPVHWLKKYPNRFKLCHIKDRIVDASGKGITCDIGKGTVDWKGVLRAAKDNRMQYYFAEQEHFVVSEMDSAEKNANYLKALRF